MIHSWIPGLGVSAHSAPPTQSPGASWTGAPAPPCSPRPPAQDPYLDKFFTLVHVLEEGAFPFRLKDGVLSESTVEPELRASLAALRLASPEFLVAFSHHVLDKLVRLVVRPPIIGGQIGERARPPASVSPPGKRPLRPLVPLARSSLRLRVPHLGSDLSPPS